MIGPATPVIVASGFLTESISVNRNVTTPDGASAAHIRTGFHKERGRTLNIVGSGAVTG